MFFKGVIIVRHMVFMKLAPGRFDERAERDYVETFGELRRALPGDILSCRVLRNARRPRVSAEVPEPSAAQDHR